MSCRLDAAVLDLVDDEASGMQAQKTRYHWMKNKFVKLNAGDRVTATGKIKTEGGAKIKASATGMYKRWQQRTHKSVNIGGKSGNFAEEGTSSSGEYQRGNKKHFAGHGRRSIPNANVPSEIRNPEQMQKSRQQKAMEITRLKNKSAKDGKFQKNRRPDGNGKGTGKGFSKGAGGKGGKGKGKVKGKGGR
ncbi:DEAD-box ATP-dependent RNA helicase 29-like [Miscanthus floridulus]|uniref:DEAD-box ATP-dependent RNA helicase 29-like n=1 Tax=Miscanthus floridulus TaxID=154761 RepID=UPI00345A663B